MQWQRLTGHEPESIYNGLSRYKKILDGEEKPRFMLALESGLLNKKIMQAKEILTRCELCARKCGVDRAGGEKGFCGVGNEPRLFGAHAHFGEEPELVPSATLFFSGCTMRCQYCQNAPESVEYGRGVVWSPARIAEWISGMAGQGCKNVNFVGGDPTSDLPWILQALRKVDADIPVVWNSNSYYSAKAADLLRHIVDVYLLDFRYFDEKCARRLSSAPGYPAVAKRNFLTAHKDAELLIRVLVMPNHIKCDAKPIIRWIRENLGHTVRTNILAQYRPCWHAGEYEEIDEPLSMSEYEQVASYARKIGLRNLVRG